MSFEISGLYSLGKVFDPTSLKKSLDTWNQKGHATTALTTITKLEMLLEKAVKLHFKNKSRKLMDKLFDYRGPAGSFSAKIDLAYALGAVSQNSYETLHVLRAIRNDIAHSDIEVDFASTKLDRHFKKLSDKTDREVTFLASAVDCIIDINKKLEPLYLAQALGEYKKKS